MSSAVIAELGSGDVVNTIIDKIRRACVNLQTTYFAATSMIINPFDWWWTGNPTAKDQIFAYMPAFALEQSRSAKTSKERRFWKRIAYDFVFNKQKLEFNENHPPMGRYRDWMIKIWAKKLCKPC